MPYDNYGQHYPQPHYGQAQEDWQSQAHYGGYDGQSQYAPPPPPPPPQSRPQQYPGQPMYGTHQTGGPVQMPQGYNQNPSLPTLSPTLPARNTSLGGSWAGNHRAQHTYNPQQYGQPQQQQGDIPMYNPQAYANTTSPTYNPAAYAEPAAQATSGPLADPYYSPSNDATPGFSPQQPSYRESPQQSQYGSGNHLSPQPPQHLYGHSQHTSPSPHQQNFYYPPAPTSGQYSQSPEVPYPTTDYYPQMPRPSSGRQHTSISPALPGLSEEPWRPSPPSYQSPPPLQSSTSYGSLPSPPGSTPGPTPPLHGAPSRSNTLDRHPTARALPRRPEPDYEQDYFQADQRMTREEMELMTQDELFNSVEDAVLNAGRQDRSPSISLTSAPYQAPGQPQPLFSPTSPESSRNANGSALNGHLSPVPLPTGSSRPQYSDDSDTEANAGLEAMRLADERDAAEEVRRQSGGSLSFGGYQSHPGSQRSTRSNRVPDREAQALDYSAVDVSTYGGGYDVHMSYGGDPSQLANGGTLNGDSRSSHHSSMRRSYDYNMDSFHPFPPFQDARVDAGGTGGNYEPDAEGRRQSFDEGDEYTLTEGHMPERFPDEPPDVFFNSTTSTHRPLPPPPLGEAPPYEPDVKGPPYAPDGYGMNAQGQWVPRSTSLISHTNTPQIMQPLRSKTDAEERRLRQSYRTSGYSTYDTTPASSSAVALDLPQLPTKRFVPSKLGAQDFKKCEEPWALSAILAWLITVVTPDQTTELKEAAVKEALVNLFTNKVPTMNIADAEVLSNRVVAEMYEAGTLITVEEWVRLNDAPMAGVIFQLTRAGCYAPTVHDHIIPGRCYAHHCQRTLKKVNLQLQPARPTESWVVFYELSKEDLEGKDSKEIERQNVLHEVVQTEEVYMDQLNVLRTLYRDSLIKTEPSIITPKRKDKFIKDVFGKLEAVKQANEDHLLPQLKYRQQEQGPWVVGYSDIFRQWIRKAKTAYVEYAGSFPGATFHVRQEAERNIHFAAFLDRARNDPVSKRLAWDTYLKSPITRLQRYTLLLQTILRNMKTESEEKTNLQVAYDEVKVVTLECDTRVAEMQRKVDLADLSAKLVLRPGMQSAVELNLNHLGRELVHRGDLQRMGGNRFTWLDSHALLFDHYLVLAKTVAQRADQGGRMEKYDVSRLPIPMDLLVLEGTNDQPVQKSSYVKGITTVSAVTGRNAPTDAMALGRTQSSNSAVAGAKGPGLQHANTGISASSLHTVTSIDQSKDDKILYPFRIKHLGRETYTLFAHTDSARREWATKIIEAKTKHAKALYAQHAEPFRMRVIADSAFVYDPFAGAGARSIVIKGTPLDRAISEVEQRFKDTGRPGPICRARVNCATSFITPYPGKQMVAVGTDFGVFISEMDNPRGWTKAISMTRVTQVAVLEEFNIFLLISDKSLLAYHLDALTNSTSLASDSSRKAPQKLSGSRDVGFFVAGRMKDRTLVFYKKRDNLSSTFKVLEPIYQKSTEKKRGIFKRGNTEFFREFDDFYIPSECNGINLFHTSLAVSTARGFEVLSLERKISESVPSVVGESVQNIVRHIKDQRALCMLRLSDQEFLLCYAKCAVYVNKHGEISRSVIMEFVGLAQCVALYGAYLVLFDNDFVEIRNAQNGRLKQIIPGREIKCLDDGGSWTAGNGPSANGGAGALGQTPGRTVKVVMQHPELERTQIVVELLLNEDMKE